MPDLHNLTLSESRRLAQVIGILGRHGLSGLSASLGIGASRGEPVSPRPDQLVTALREIGPVAVKFGQVLAMRSDMLPSEWTSALATLQDRVPAVAFSEVRHSIEAALGAPVSEYFERFDETPLAAGSIAQVHAAVRKDGVPVIVKIRRPGIEEIVDADLRLLRRVARLAQRVNPSVARQRPDELLRFFAESLDREMDLSAEGSASEEIGTFLADFGVETAQFDWDATGRSINMQERVDALPATDLDRLRAAGIDLSQVARTYAQAVLRMIVINGRFHADPHPGNLLVKTDGTLVFIDFGAVGTLLPHRRDELVELSLAIAAEDTASLADVLLGWAGDPAVDREALVRALAGLIDRFKASVLAQIDLGEIFAEVFRLLREFQLSLPPDLALMLRTLLTAEGFVRRIDPRFDIGAELAPIARQLLRERAGFGELRDKARRTVTLLGRAALNAPELILALEKIVRSGRLPINLDRRDLELLARGGRQQSLAGHHVISAALIIAAALLLEGQPTLAGGCALLSGSLIVVNWFRRE